MSHLYLAAPCRDGRLSIQFMSAVLELQLACRARGVGLTVDLLTGDPLITRARSRLAARFLATPEATHLLFCDVDIAFGAHDAFRLLESGKPVIAAVCPLKHIDWEKVRAAALAGAADLQAAGIGYVVRFLPTAGKRVEVEGGFARVAYAGTGFQLIARDALQRVADAHPELTAKLDDPLAPEAVMVFDTMVEPETGHYLSEDYAFCRRWRDLGGEVWADVEAKLTHVGHTAYTGSAMQALKPV